MKQDKVIELLDRVYVWVEQTEELIKQLVDEKDRLKAILEELYKQNRRLKDDR